jgi:trigger factor
MQVVEKSSEGLSRVLSVTVPQKELTDQLDAKIAEVGPRLKIKGFRPGKVPASHVRKMFGKELMSEIVQDTLNQSPAKALEEAKIRPAAPADMKLESDVEKVVAGEADLAYEMTVDVMPDFEPIDPATLKLSRPTYEASDKDIDDSLKNISAQSRTYEAKGGKAPKADDGDMVVMDFVGRVDGETFEGGSATDSQLVLGSGQFIPGFEEQLKGAKAGDEKLVKVTFPENYGAAHLAGKDAEFTVTVKEIRAPKDAAADEEFAKRLGMESLDKLKDAIRGQLNEHYVGASRFKLKRALLDELDAKHDFPLPEKMVDNEFETIWTQVVADKEAGRLPEEDAKKSDKALKAEYRKIAERRVRLGLVLAELGRRANITVTDQELGQAITAEARRYPGQEKQVFDFYRANPNAAAQLRAPIYEEKVCDMIFRVAKVTDKKVKAKEELFDGEDDI